MAGGAGRSEAEALYGEVIERAARDPASTFWQTQTLRAQALAHLGRHDEAVAAVLRAEQNLCALAAGEVKGSVISGNAKLVSATKGRFPSQPGRISFSLGF